jgi:hypothetical protein
MGFAIIVGWVSNPMASAGLLVGLKLIVFGSALIWIAFRAFRGEHALIYEPAHVTPEVGELYAVYFGTAFHLGVYIGNSEVVHYLDDGLVHRATWDEFCEGREPRHWSYPDLNHVPPETVVATALAEVGKTYPYSLVKFNCEHFAIFCKTGGRTTHSRFAQVVVGVNDVIENPFLGTIAELNTRFVEWLAFHFGGPPGKRLSLVIRRVGAVVTNFLLLTRLRS